MAKIVFIILFIILGATFCTLNRQEIFLRYFFGWNTGSFPLYLLVLTSIVAGMAVGISVGWGERRKLRAQSRDLGRRVKTLKEEIETLTPKEEIAEPQKESLEGKNPPEA